MIPRILSSDTIISTVNYNDFSGYDPLSDILKGSYSREELHTGVLTLTFNYPSDGVNADKLVGDAFVLYKINSYEVPHLFIINQVEKSSDGLTYDVFCDSATYLADIDETTYFELEKGATANNFITKLNTIGDLKAITLETDIVGTLPNGFKSKNLRNKIDLLNSNSKDSFIMGFGGYLKRFKNKIQVLTRRGSDRNTILRYGDNIQEVSYEADYSKVITAVKYVCDEKNDGNVLSSSIIYSTKNPTHNLNHLKTISISKYELQKEFGFNYELQELLNLKAALYFSYANNVDIDSPDISLTLKIDEQKSVYGKLFDNAVDFEFKLGDRVKLVVDRMKIDLTSEITSIDYDGVKESIKELKFGKVKRYINQFYKEDFIDPNSTTGFDSNDWAEQIADSLFPDLTEVPIDEPILPEVINDGGAPSFTFDNYNVTIADGGIWSDPILTPILKNVDSNEIYIISGMTATLGDLYGPKSSMMYDNDEIVNGSRLKYMEYSEGRVKFKWSQWLADCYAAGITEESPVWDEYIFHPPHNFSIKLAVKNASSYKGIIERTVYVTVAGTLGEDNPALNDPLNPFEYLNYMKTSENSSKLMFYLTSRMLLHQAIITNEVNVKSIFDGSTIAEDNIEISQKLFDKIVEIAVDFHSKETPDVAIRDFTDEEYLIYREAYVNSRLGITTAS